MSNNYNTLQQINIVNITTNKNINLYSVKLFVVEESTRAILYVENMLIQSDYNNFNTQPSYFISTYYRTPDTLTTLNFDINLPSGYYFIYDNILLTIYIYQQNNYIPITFLGSINTMTNTNALTKITYKLVGSNTISFTDNITNFSGFNYINRTVSMSGQSISIINIISVDPSTSNVYKNYTNLDNVSVNNLLKIYIYDYSYYKIKNIIIQNETLNNLLPTRKTDVINFVIDVLDTNGDSYYKYIVNLNYDLIDNDNNYSLVIFFKNFISNQNYTDIKLYVFEYDYYKFFSNLTKFDYELLPKIILTDAILYDLLIGSNDNLITPTIPTINVDDFNTYLDKIMIINNLFLNQNINVISEFLKSSLITIDLLADYLCNFNIKPDNFWKLTSNYSNILNLDVNNFLLNSLLMNVNIIYGIISDDTTIDNFSYYNLYAELFNNNNNIDLYHKKYDISNVNNVNNVNKKSLITNCIIMILNYVRINCYFYNDITDLDNVLGIFKNTIITNPYIKFNNFILPKSNVNLRFDVDQFYNLKFVIDLQLSFKILVFKNNTISDTILKFKTNNYIFEIFNIPEINGNIDNENNIFYIVFNSINETNEFMNFITNGILAEPNNISSFFNITNSLYFKKNDLTGYYELSSETTSVINFTILNLDLTVGSIFNNNITINTY